MECWAPHAAVAGQRAGCPAGGGARPARQQRSQAARRPAGPRQATQTQSTHCQPLPSPTHRVRDAGVPQHIGDHVRLRSRRHHSRRHDQAGGEAEVGVVLPACVVKVWCGSNPAVFVWFGQCCGAAVKPGVACSQHPIPASPRRRFLERRPHQPARRTWQRPGATGCRASTTWAAAPLRQEGPVGVGKARAAAEGGHRSCSLAARRQRRPRLPRHMDALAAALSTCTSMARLIGGAGDSSDTPGSRWPRRRSAGQLAASLLRA